MSLMLVAFTIALLMGMLIAIAVTRMPNWLKVVLVLAFGFRLVYAYIILGRNGLSHDSRSYHEEAHSALIAYQHGSTHASNSLFIGKEGWPILLKYVYRIVGPEPFAGLIINAVALTLVSVIVYKTSKLLRLSDNGASVAAMSALLPQFTLWSGLLLREAIIWFAVSLIGYFATRAVTRTGNGAFSIASLALSVALLFTFRASLAVVFGFALMLSVVFAKTVPIYSKLGASALALASLPIVFAYLDESSLLDSGRIDMSRSELSAATTGFTTGSGGDLISQLVSFPEGLVRVLVGPFPWEVINLGPIAGVEWLCWIVLIVPVAWATRRLPPGGKVLVVLGLASLIALAISISNYGTLARLRIMTIVMLLPLVGVAWDALDARMKVERILKVDHPWREGQPAVH